MSSIDNSFQQLPLKEKQLPSRRNSTTSNFKKFSKPPCFLLSPLPNITLISRKQCSIAYYVDLETPEQKKNRVSRTLRRFGRGKPFKLTPATRSPTFATSPAPSLANPTARNRSCPLETRPPHSTWNCDNANEQCFKSPHRGDELMHRLNSQCLKASLRRKTLLRERKLKIRARLDTVIHRAVLQKHRHSLMLLRSRVRHDFAASAAYLKRQLILQQKTELWSAAVERAQNVALLNRLKKCILLRRAYSERLAELLHSSGFQTPARSTNDIFAPTRPILSLPDSANLFCSATDDSPFSDEHDAVSPVFSCPSSCSTDEAGLEPSVLTKPESDDESDAGLEAEELRFSRWRPPINRDTLAELDLEEMRTNVQLRHDLIFDPNLQFRPNVSGESGLAKKARWEQYWEKLRLELEGPSKEVATRGASFIPILIWEAREIMLMLFPFEDEVCQQLSAKMDVSLIAQELEHNVFDVIGFANWLVSTLKVHCAPQRQDATDDIINAVKEGRLASAFRSLFELLELMKLDTANDQLSNIFRPYVLEHAVVFEWRHFKLQLEAGLTALDGTMRWLAQGKARNPGQEFDETFYESVVQLVATSTSDMTLPLPETFQMDGSRLHGFHNDYQDISIMATILLLFRQLAGSRCEFSHVMKMKSELWTLLVEVGTTMEHITAQVLRSAQQIRQRPFSPSERVLMANLVDRTLSSNSKVFKLVQTRVTKVLKDFFVEDRKKSTGVTNRMVPAGSEPRTNADLVKVAPLNEAILRKYGLLELEDGIFDLAVRIRQLTEHNRAVHIMSYRSIWSSLDAESESEENDLPVILSRGLADRSFVEYDGAEEPQKQGSTNNEVAVC